MLAPLRPPRPAARASAIPARTPLRATSCRDPGRGRRGARAVTPPPVDHCPSQPAGCECRGHLVASRVKRAEEAASAGGRLPRTALVVFSRRARPPSCAIHPHAARRGPGPTYAGKKSRERRYHEGGLGEPEEGCLLPEVPHRL